MANKNSKETQHQGNAEEGRVTTRYDRKLQRREEEALRQKKRKMAVMGTGIVIVAICIVAVAFLIYAKVGESISYIKIDDKSISRSEFNYYYNMAVNEGAATYSSYGLDTTKPLDQQQYILDNSITWKDHFEQMATEQIVRVKAMLKDAEKNNFKGDVEEEYQRNVQTIAEMAKTNKVSEKEYYEKTYGDAKEDIEEYVKENILASQWYEEVSDKQDITDEAIEEYYKENKMDYDRVSYYISTVTAEGVTVGSSSDAEMETAMALARTKAEAQLNSIESSGELVENAGKSGKTVLVEWLFADERKKDDTAVLDDTGSALCYAVKFCKRERNEEPSADFYAVMTNDEKADENKILEEWKSGEKTEESFIKLVDKYTQNTSVKDGFFEGTVADDVANVPGLSDWLFDKDRKEGDTVAMTSDDGGKFVIYYKGENEPGYKLQIRASLLNTAMQDYIKKLTDPIKVADPNGVLKYLSQAGGQ